MAEQSRFSVDSIESKRDESDEGEHGTCDQQVGRFRWQDEAIRRKKEYSRVVDL